jgi:hypothetical protein
MHTGKAVSPMAAHPMQSFVAGYRVAYAFISEKQRPGPALD